MVYTRFASWFVSLTLPSPPPPPPNLISYLGPVLSPSRTRMFRTHLSSLQVFNNPFTARVFDGVLWGDSTKFWVYGRNPMMWPFKWKLSAYTFRRCYLFLRILENEICKFGRNLPLATFGSERVKRASTGSQITITRPYSLWGLRNYQWMTKLQLRVTKNKLLKTVRLTIF